MAHWNPRANHIFASLVELPAPQRQAALDQACAGDEKLRGEVEALLLAHAQAGSFLDQDVNPAGIKTVAHEANGVDPMLGMVRDVGDYELLAELGRGGMGVVYKARHLKLGRLVALKMILSGGHARAADLARFRTEAEAIARLQHPNIVQVYEVGEHDGRPFFSLEFCAGGSLDKKLNGTPLPGPEAARLLETLARAMQAAHDKNVIHRDLKPANVLLAEDGTPKITDFGLAKKLDDVGQTASGAIMGTPSYMAPEQADGKRLQIGPACDIYALGAILYELLTGRPPFKTTTAMDTLMQVLLDEPVRPSQLQPKTPRELETICLKCLHKAAGKRYGSAAALANELGRFLRGEPIEARPAGWTERGWKWAKRRPTAAALLVVSVLALLVLLVGGLWFNTRLTEERNEALGQKKTAEEKTTLAEVEKTRAEIQLRRAEMLVYAEQMARAQSAFENNDGTGALQLLEQCQWNLRGWEHRYLWTRLSSLATFVGHKDPVNCVAFSTDGRRILTGSNDGMVKVWDAARGQELLSLQGHTHAVSSLAFSPDGRRILTGSCYQDGATFKGEAKGWDAATGQELFALQGRTGFVTSMAFSPDGRRILTGGSNTAKLWTADKGQELFPLKGDTGQVSRMAFSPDSRRILTTSSQDGKAKMWDAATGQELFTFQVQTGKVLGGDIRVAFSPDGRRLLTGSGYLDGALFKGEAKVWDAATGQQLFSLQGLINYVSNVAFSPDGRRLLTVSHVKTEKIWDTGKGQIMKMWDADKGLELFSIKGGSGDVTSVTFSPDGRRLLTGSSDRTAKLWDADKEEKLFSLKGITKRGSRVAFSPNGRLVLTGTLDGAVKMWDAEKGQELFSLKGHAGSVNGVAFSPDGRTILTCSSDRTAKVRDADTGKHLLSLQGHTSVVTSVAFSLDGRRILTGSWDQTAKVWDAHTGQQLFSLEGQTGYVYSVAFSPDGRRILTGSHESTAKVWDAATGQELFSLKGHAGRVFGVAFSPDGRRILTGCEDNMAKVWDADTGRQLLSLERHTDKVLSVAFSPDGRRILTGSADKTAKMWDANTGLQLFSLQGHPDEVKNVAFSPDGQRIVTGSFEIAARVWDAAKSQELFFLQGHTDQMTSVAFSSDGRQVFAQDEQGKILAWDTTTGHLLPDPPAQMPAAGQQAASPDGRLLVRIHNGTPVVERVTNRSRGDHPDRAALEELARFDPDIHTARLLEAEGADDDFAMTVHLGHLVRQQPWAADLLVKQAQVFARQGQTEQAALTLTRALLLNPHVSFADPWFAARGDRAAQVGNWPRAITFLRLLTQQPGASDVLRSNLLLAELAAGETGAARRTAGAIIAMLPDQGDADVAALTATLLSEADAAKWEQLARQAVVRQRDAQTLHNHGVALYRADKHAEAAKVLAESIKASGGEGSAQTWLFQALVAQKQGQHAEALGLLARYIIWHQKQTFPDWQQRVLNQLLLAEAQREVTRLQDRPPQHSARFPPSERSARR